MGAGVFISVASAVSLAVLPGWIGVSLFGVLEALAVPLVAVPFSSESYALVSTDPRGQRRSVGYMVAREIPLNLGRLVGVAVLLLVVEGIGWRGGLGAVLVGVTLANVAAWWMLLVGWQQEEARG